MLCKYMHHLPYITYIYITNVMQIYAQGIYRSDKIHVIKCFRYISFYYKPIILMRMQVQLLPTHCVKDITDGNHNEENLIAGINII